MLANAIGWGQTWQTPTRVAGTVYQNTTGRPIMVHTQPSTLGAGRNLEVSVDNAEWVVAGSSGAVELKALYAIVPPNHYYRQLVDFSLWRELR